MELGFRMMVQSKSEDVRVGTESEGSEDGAKWVDEGDTVSGRA